jgi:hypothetical protein
MQPRKFWIFFSQHVLECLIITIWYWGSIQLHFAFLNILVDKTLPKLFTEIEYNGMETNKNIVYW